jgi:hypothetical protein
MMFQLVALKLLNFWTVCFLWQSTKDACKLFFSFLIEDGDWVILSLILQIQAVNI